MRKSRKAIFGFFSSRLRALAARVISRLSYTAKDAVSQIRLMPVAAELSRRTAFASKSVALRAVSERPTLLLFFIPTIQFPLLAEMMGEL